MNEQVPRLRGCDPARVAAVRPAYGTTILSRQKPAPAASAGVSTDLLPALASGVVSPRRLRGQALSRDSSPERLPPRVGSLDLDWRFLLPPPRGARYARLLLLGASPSLAAKVDATDLADEVALAPTGRKADAVICLSGARLTLEEAAEQVAAGGVLYYEADGGLRRVRTSPARLLRSLRRLKLSPTGLYCVHPSYTGPRTYFPLDVDGALRWYLNNLHSSSAPLPGVDWALRRLAQLDPMRVGRLIPRLAVLAVADARGNTLPLPLSAAELPPPLKEPGLRPLLLIHGTDLTRAVMLPFSSTSREPLAVIKIRRGADDGDSHESAVLDTIRNRLDTPMRATIPEPLGVIRSDGYVATIESFLPGEWLHARLARRRLPLREAIEDLRLATDWVTDLHSRFPVGMRAWSESDLRTYVDGPIEAYDEAFGTTATESRLFAELRRRARDLLATPLQVVWQHGDFSNLNVLRSGRQIHVVDWERAAPGIPLDDVLHFTRLWLYLARKANRNESFVAFRDLFLEAHCDDRAVDAARDTISQYMRTLRIDPRFLPLLLAVGCVRRATDRLEGQAFLHARVADPRARNRYVTYIGLISEHPAALLELEAAFSIGAHAG